MAKLKKAVSLVLAAGMLFSLSSCALTNKVDISEYFNSTQKTAYCTTYKQLSQNRENKTSYWRQGMVSGNGLSGFVESGSPYSDTLIFQNMHFIMPNTNSRNCPVTYDELETVKQSIVNVQDITDDASYDEVYYYHPGGELRIDSEKHLTKDYIRYTDYEKGEVGVKYTDKNGLWQRKSFTSQADNVTVTSIGQSDALSKVNITLSFDDISVMANYNDGNEKDIQYKKIVGDDCDYIEFIAHYPDYENSELRNGGYATLTYIVCEGGSKECVDGSKTKDKQYVGDGNKQVKISDADNVYLITVTGRTHTMGSLSDFAQSESYALTDELLSSAKAVAQKYTTDGKFDYEAALQSHTEIFTPQFNAVTISLNDTENTLSNEELIKNAKGSKQISSQLAEKAYYAGRYACLSCAGYSTSRLYGMWTGEWNTGWGSKYTMDANVNLQTSSMNSSNIKSAPVGYTYFILRQLPGWEENAFATHGYTDAIQAPVNTDGDISVITETCYPYPFRYWNAGTSWMLQPLYETLEYYGDVTIPLSDEFDLDNLKSVLSLSETDLTQEQIDEMKQKGSLDLRTDILLPLLTKAANYWEQMLSAEYYTDKDGNIHYEQGKTVLNDGESYCILPSYSPENNPKNYSSPSTANCAIDITACRSNMNMLIDIAKSVNPDADVTKWENLRDNLPPYLYDETGALKEWACNQFEENNEHRHLSHLYCVWPLDETQNDASLKAACEQAINNRESENEASHALIHRSLIAARLKDRQSLSTALTTLMNSKIYYNSLMSNHNFDRSSCYCTDFEIGYLGIINESLVYSDTGKIEILPALATTGFENGSISGLKARTQATIDKLSWDTEKGTATVTITSDKAQTIDVSCGLSDEVNTISFAQGESKTLTFTLTK